MSDLWPEDQTKAAYARHYKSKVDADGSKQPGSEQTPSETKSLTIERVFKFGQFTFIDHIDESQLYQEYVTLVHPIGDITQPIRTLVFRYRNRPLQWQVIYVYDHTEGNGMATPGSQADTAPVKSAPPTPQKGDDERPKLHELVAEYRKSRQMTQTEFAEYYGYKTPTAASYWERAIRSVPNDITEDVIAWLIARKFNGGSDERPL